MLFQFLEHTFSVKLLSHLRDWHMLKRRERTAKHKGTLHASERNSDLLLLHLGIWGNAFSLHYHFTEAIFYTMKKTHHARVEFP